MIMNSIKEKFNFKQIIKATDERISKNNKLVIYKCNKG